MKIVRFDDPGDFWEICGDFLLTEEARNCVMIGLCASLRAGRSYGERTPYLIAVADGDEVVAAAIRTPPHPVTISESGRADAVAALAGHIAATDPDLDGVNLPRTVERPFLDAFTEATGRTARLGMAQRVFQLERVSPPDGVPGRLRPARPEDLEILADWQAGFVTEALGSDPGPRDERLAGLSRVLESPVAGVVVWEDGGPVSMAGWAGPTPNGMRVNRVYTPPEIRGRGYASACVAALSQRLLDEGRRYCFLYTDLANPTSNKIYQQIGYEPKGDVAGYEFIMGGPSRSAQ